MICPWDSHREMAEDSVVLHDEFCFATDAALGKKMTPGSLP